MTHYLSYVTSPINTITNYAARPLVAAVASTCYLGAGAAAVLTPVCPILAPTVPVLLTAGTVIAGANVGARTVNNYVK
jgi:hypothetical protein